MAIRQTPSAAVVPNVITGSGYASADVLGNPFQILYAAGGRGAWLGTMTMFDYGSAGSAIRVHLFNDEPSAYNPTGTPFSIANADDDKYLGYVDMNTWQSAGAAKRVAVAFNPGLAIYSLSGARHIWGVAQAKAALTFGDATNPLRLFTTTLQDEI